jgi:hypothetical protein
MGKVICLISPAPHSIYFVNRIHERFPVALVIWEEGKRAPFSVRQKLARAAASPMSVVGAFEERLTNRGKRHEIEQRIFGPSSAKLHDGIEVMRVASVNDPSVLARLSAERPDIVVDHGTSIVRDPILATAAVALNLHWGLSPYYRGVQCTEWALINWDVHNIGVTPKSGSRSKRMTACTASTCDSAGRARS